MRRLRKVRPPWDLRVEQLPVDDPVALAIVEGMPQASLVCGGSVPGVDFVLDGSIEAHLSGNLRRQLRKCRNRMSTDGVEVATEFIRDRAQLLGYLAEVEHIHRTRDSDVGRKSDLDDPAVERLWRGIISAHVDRDQVELGIMRIDGNIAAYVLSFMDGVTYRVFDGRFLTKWMRYSPGRLLEVEMLAHAMSDGRFQRLDWMNSIAPNKLISANTLEHTANLIASSE
jgi:CelD/BcsL family acetyltransferase involved in cellulose biosynthesis